MNVSYVEYVVIFSDMKKTLHDLGRKHKTDKAELHDFCNFYEKHICSLRDEPIRFLELGVLKGCSLRMWKDWFSCAEIHGIDAFEHKGQESLTNLGTKLHTVDLENPDQLNEFSQNNGMFHVIVDDAGHTMEQQQRAFFHLWKNISPEGFYIIEDLHTSLIPEKINKYTHVAYNAYDQPTTLEMIEAMAEKKDFSSTWISKDVYSQITSEVEFVLTFRKKQNKSVQSVDSITSIIKKRNTYK